MDHGNSWQIAFFMVSSITFLPCKNKNHMYREYVSIIIDYTSHMIRIYYCIMNYTKIKIPLKMSKMGQYRHIWLPGEVLSTVSIDFYPQYVVTLNSQYKRKLS